MRTHLIFCCVLAMVGCTSSASSPLEPDAARDGSNDGAGEGSVDGATDSVADQLADQDGKPVDDTLSGDAACVSTELHWCSEEARNLYRDGKKICCSRRATCSSIDCRNHSSTRGSYNFSVDCNPEGWVSYVETPCEPPWEFGDSGPDGSDFGKD